jgi:hypothetical protein
VTIGVSVAIRSSEDTLVPPDVSNVGSFHGAWSVRTVVVDRSEVVEPLHAQDFTEAPSDVPR